MKPVLLLGILFFSLYQARGQSPVTDSITDQTAVNSTVDRYHDLMGAQALVYNGAAFISYDPSLIGHVFFEKDSLRSGSVSYDGVWYRGILLLYDLVGDKLVISNLSNNYFYPASDKVSRFILGGHTFINTPKGYYDVLCTGNFGIQAKRVKEIEEHVSTQDLTRTVSEKDRFYLVKGDGYHPVGNVRSLLALMGDKKGEVRQYLRKNKISLRKNTEVALVAAATYYNQLSRQAL